MSGTVTDKDGKGVTSVVVKLAPVPNWEKRTGKDPAAIASATTDQDGKFTMSDIAPGSYNAIVIDAAKGSGRNRVTVKVSRCTVASGPIEPPAVCLPARTKRRGGLRAAAAPY